MSYSTYGYRYSMPSYKTKNELLKLKEKDLDEYMKELHEYLSSYSYKNDGVDEFLQTMPVITEDEIKMSKVPCKTLKLIKYIHKNPDHSTVSLDIDFLNQFTTLGCYSYGGIIDYCLNELKIKPNQQLMQSLWNDNVKSNETRILKMLDEINNLSPTSDNLKASINNHNIPTIKKCVEEYRIPITEAMVDEIIPSDPNQSYHLNEIKSTLNFIFNETDFKPSKELITNALKIGVEIDDVGRFDFDPQTYKAMLQKSQLMLAINKKQIKEINRLVKKEKVVPDMDCLKEASKNPKNKRIMDIIFKANHNLIPTLDCLKESIESMRNNTTAMILINKMISNQQDD